MNDDLLKQFKRRNMEECRHFNGTQNGTCKAGVTYDSVSEAPDPVKHKPLRLPCMLTGLFGGADLPCEKRSVMEAEEAEREATETVAIAYQNAEARKVAKDDAHAKGLKRGNGGYGSVACTRCKIGTLKYSVASLNGHMHGRCSTPNCVRWME